jgi:hypothetical protein
MTFPVPVTTTVNCDCGCGWGCVGVAFAEFPPHPFNPSMAKRITKQKVKDSHLLISHRVTPLGD